MSGASGGEVSRLVQCIVVFVLLHLGNLPGLAQTGKTFVVGLETRSFVDEGRHNYSDTGARPLQTVIWFPASPGTTAAIPPDPDSPVKGMFVLQPIASNGLLARGQKYPLIVLSHGSSSLAYSMSWLGWYLASHGYIVAGVNHHGNTGAEPKMVPQGFMLEWDRPKDLSVLIDKMLADPKFGPHIDATRIGAAGHSAGGATVIEVAGGKFDVQSLSAFCNEHPNDAGCDVPPIFKQWMADFEKIRNTDPVIQEELLHQNDSQRDIRVKAVFAMAPAVGHAFSEKTLHAIHIPVYVVTGAGDNIVSAANNAEWYAQNIPGAQLKIFPGNAGHFVFGSDCTLAGVKALFVCQDPEGVSRGELHRETERLALQFFDRTLSMH
jgi:predicted dienelactone hydrolase